MMMGMEQNPYEAPRESAVSDQKGSAWNAVGISIAIAIAIGIRPKIPLFVLLAFWLSQKNPPMRYRLRSLMLVLTSAPPLISLPAKIQRMREAYCRSHCDGI